jgi:polysaccharide biosynthesis/export protein
MKIALFVSFTTLAALVLGAQQEATPTNPAPCPAVDSKTYVIGPGDVLQINCVEAQQLNQSYTVRPDGKISVMFAGELLAADSTPEQLQNAIARRLKDGNYIKAPNVAVQVLQVHSKKYYMDGEFNRPGVYELMGSVSVMDAISTAGGFREWARTKDVRVLRGDQVLHFNYNDFLEGRRHDQNYALQPGDHVLVK